jgi:hypothetical protein
VACKSLALFPQVSSDLTPFDRSSKLFERSNVCCSRPLLPLYKRRCATPPRRVATALSSRRHPRALYDFHPLCFHTLLAPNKYIQIHMARDGT